MRDEPLTFTITPGRREGSTILRLVGPLTLGNLFPFQKEFRALKPQALLVDLKETPYMAAAGLGVLMNYYVAAEKEGRRLLLVAVNTRIAALLTMTNVHALLKTYPTVEGAEAAL